MRLLIHLWRYLLLFSAVLLVGSLSFMYFETRSFWESIYYSIVTVSTVGYGDIHPSTTAGKVTAIFLIVVGVGTFLSLLGEITELTVKRREIKTRKSKINILVGLFFSEIGSELLNTLYGPAKKDNPTFKKLAKIEGMDRREYQRLRKELSKTQLKLDKEKIDIHSLNKKLSSNKELMIRLLENPMMLEHETFTDLIRSIFHLCEELSYRIDHEDLTDADIAHLTIDTERVFTQLLPEWLKYIEELKAHYPHLYIFAIKLNPFKEA